MGLFTRKVSVTVMGNRPMDGGGDGRYKKQARRNKKIANQKKKALVLEPHTTAELRGYIESKYGVSELSKTDERFKRAYMNVKSHLVFTYAPELLETAKIEAPDHPPVSDTDPDYEAYYSNEKERWREAVMVSNEAFPIHLHVYNIHITTNGFPIAWLEVYVETDHQFLDFHTVKLEFEEHYSIDQVKKDIISYFGASKEDKKEKNSRYLQLLSVQ